MSVLASMFIFFCAIWICHPDKFSITSSDSFMTMPLTRSFHVFFFFFEALMITINFCWASKSNKTLDWHTWVLPCIILWATGVMTWKCPMQNFDSSAVLFPILLVGLWNWRLWPVLVGIRRFMNIVLIIIRLRYWLFSRNLWRLSSSQRHWETFLWDRRWETNLTWGFTIDGADPPRKKM